MCACFKTMQNNYSTSAMSAEAAASACAFLLLGSALVAESIFVVISGILGVYLIITTNKATAW